MLETNESIDRQAREESAVSASAGPQALAPHHEAPNAEKVASEHRLLSSGDCSCGWKAGALLSYDQAAKAWMGHFTEVAQSKPSEVPTGFLEVPESIQVLPPGFKFRPFVTEQVSVLKEEVARLTALINTPEIIDFVKAVQIEAVHQRERWGTEQDEGKTAADWFWLLGYLAGKALHSDKVGDQKKLLHHIITTAAACANWHAQIIGKCDMRPGIATPEGEAHP